MTVTVDQLKDGVRKEAAALLIHATNEERMRLDFETMRPFDPKRCIYGQMTGEFDNNRADELAKLCSPFFVDGDIQSFTLINISETFIDFCWTPIQYYILGADANNENLIAFLRGETEALEL
jgi:hypothetical protein